MAEGCKDLPDECWELIFNKLEDNPSHLEPLSLVCKRFLSITNGLRSHFTITNPTIFIHGTLSKIFNRFPNLKSIDLSRFGGDLDRVILEIAASDLNLEALNVSGTNRLPLEGLNLLGLRMKNLRDLACSGILTFRDIELVAIADSMPCLEELDICCYLDNGLGSDPELQPLSPRDVCVTDHGIEYLSSRLKGLRKIDISGNEFLTDKSLLALSSNCALLSEIAVLCCQFVTPYGIEFLLHNSKNLSSISFSAMVIERPYMHLPFTDYNSLTCARNLSTLEIYSSGVPDEYLHLLAKAGIPLKRFRIAHCPSFTFSGISFLLNNYRSLEHLAFIGIDFLTDEEMGDLSRYLSSVITISLDLCSKLTESTLFTLAKNCPFLQEFSMTSSNLGGGGGSAATIVKKNPRITSLNLANNFNMTNECLRKIAFVCPSLEMLDVSYCNGITETGIANFLMIGSAVRDLRIAGCGGIKNIGTGSELPRLEVLEAARSGINDIGLAMIGSRCCGILTLNLEGCLGVTAQGLKEILTNCKRLREMNLYHCVNVGMGIVDWMVFSRPSLRKITVSCLSLPTERQRKLHLRHGCLVRSGQARAEQESLSWMEPK